MVHNILLHILGRGDRSAISQVHRTMAETKPIVQSVAAFVGIFLCCGLPAIVASTGGLSVLGSSFGQSAFGALFKEVIAP